MIGHYYLRAKYYNSQSGRFLQGAAGFQAHHMLQRKWAEANLSDYGYDKGKAPTISLGTGGECDVLLMDITQENTAKSIWDCL